MTAPATAEQPPPSATTILLLPAVLGHYRYRDIGSLACVCKGFSEHLTQREDSWAVICANMARELHLYSPTTYAHGWKQFFWEHLMVRHGNSTQNLLGLIHPHSPKHGRHPGLPCLRPWVM